MKLCGVCILTDNAPRLAEFYEIVLKESPVVKECITDSTAPSLRSTIRAK